MAFLHSHSSECAKSELDLFTLPPTQTTIEQSDTIYYNPMATITSDTPIEFVVTGHGEHYIDLSHTMVKIRARIVKADGTADVNDPVGPVNYPAASLFSQVDVTLNQKSVSSTNVNYGYRAIIETLLNYGADARATHLKMGLWSKDTPGSMSAAAKPVAPVTAKNYGLEDRIEYTAGGRQFDMLAHLHCDIFNQDKFLLNGVEMRIRLVRTKDAFCLMDNNTAHYKFEILEAALLVRRVKLSPGVLLAHAKTLSTTTAKYPITRVEVKSFVIHNGVLSESIDNAVLGQLPKRIIIGLVDNRAFNGNRKFNPYDFQTFSLNYLSLYVDGKQVPGKPLQPNYDDRHSLSVEAYGTLFSGTGIHFGDSGHCISREDYADGYALYAFDLTPDLSAHCATHWNLVKTGSVRIEVQFGTALVNNVNCIVYTEYDNIVEIDSSRQVIVDFSN